jgi:hypothetical protein
MWQLFGPLMQRVTSEDEMKEKRSYHGNANTVNIFHHSLERCVLLYKGIEVGKRGNGTTPKGKIIRRVKLDDAVQ